MLLKHAAFLTQAWNKGLPVVEVTRLLKIEAAEWKDSDAASGHKEGDAAGNGRAPVTLRGVTDAALRRAILENDSFLQVAAEIEGLDLETNEGRSAALEAALLSGLSIFQRFFANPSCLVTKGSAPTGKHLVKRWGTAGGGRGAIGNIIGAGAAMIDDFRTE